MLLPKNENWLSVHLFYTEPMDVFLAQAVKPFIDTIMKTGAASRYFFIRYREQGPHIRLRIKGEQEVLEKIIRTNIEEHFSNYFKMYPSIRVDPNFHPDTPANQRWLPNNAYHFEAYQPELQRYGGPHSIELAEKQFFYSSSVVLEAIDAVLTKTWNYQKAMGTALKLHLGLAYAAAMSIDKAADFFAAIYAHWLPFAIARDRVSQQQYEKQLKTISENYEQGFQDQKSEMVSYHAAIWEAFVNEEEFEENYLNQWLVENKRIGLEFRLAQAQQMLVPRPKGYLMKIDEHIEPEDQNVWQYYADFVHLTNNRLGIGNEDESYLAYLLMRSLEEML